MGNDLREKTVVLVADGQQLHGAGLATNNDITGRSSSGGHDSIIATFLGLASDMIRKIVRKPLRSSLTTVHQVFEE